jgi:hypothetical protein
MNKLNQMLLVAALLTVTAEHAESLIIFSTLSSLAVVRICSSYFHYTFRDHPPKVALRIPGFAVD